MIFIPIAGFFLFSRNIHQSNKLKPSSLGCSELEGFSFGVKMLTSLAVREFKEIYEEEFATELSEDEAFEMANNFFELGLVVVQPLPEVGK